MSLPTGRYFIRSVAQRPGNRVGRFVTEDRSLLPKRIVNAADDDVPHPWVVEKQGTDYTFSNNGARVGVSDGKLFAFLVDEPNQLWRVEPVDGEAFRIVNAAEETSGWVLDEGDKAQKLGESDRAKELWVFSPAQ
ncbi:hypothetical protein FA15DRAFT_697328 [Coprinopsis marcescibilis]|uniref:Ricin B lectin domain-containing protein n=1 Tax=Coprinopsis marcescibilis TaxID=230819 RepID=A0A5C3KV26_COPMA|nr:hypothetical protein FA15DRAFT_697328 [Coprinopsis marcescibilis]